MEFPQKSAAHCIPWFLVPTGRIGGKADVGHEWGLEKISIDRLKVRNTWMAGTSKMKALRLKLQGILTKKITDKCCRCFNNMILKNVKWKTLIRSKNLHVNIYCLRYETDLFLSVWEAISHYDSFCRLRTTLIRLPSRIISIWRSLKVCRVR